MLATGKRCRRIRVALQRGGKRLGVWCYGRAQARRQPREISRKGRSDPADAFASLLDVTARARLLDEVRALAGVGTVTLRCVVELQLARRMA